MQQKTREYLCLIAEEKDASHSWSRRVRSAYASAVPAMIAALQEWQAELDLIPIEMAEGGLKDICVRSARQ